MKNVIKSYVVGLPVYLKKYPKRNTADSGTYTHDLERALKFEGWYEAQQALNLLTVRPGDHAPRIVNFQRAEVEEVMES